LHCGKVGKNVTLEQAQEAARLCVFNALAQVPALHFVKQPSLADSGCWQVRAELGSLNQVRRVIKVVGFVASAEGISCSLLKVLKYRYLSQALQTSQRLSMPPLVLLAHIHSSILYYRPAC
jgi:hypothetical protein